MKRVKQIVMMAFASLLAQCVWAETYTWTGADLASGTQKGNYTLTLNSGATYANNAISITQRESGDTSDGVSIGLNNHATPMTYIVKYSGLNPTTANNVFFCVQRKDGTKQQVYFKKGNAANTYVTFAEGDNCNNKRSFFSAPPAAGTLVIVSNSGNLAFAVTTDDTKPLSDLYYYSCDDASMGASYVNTLRIGGTTAGFNKLHRPAMTISSIQIMEEAVATKTTSTTFVPANDTDWAGKTLTINTREVAAQGDVSFAGSPVYTQTIDSKATTAALVTSAPAGSFVYGLHALRGEEAGLGNITRDVYVSVTGGTIGAISGGEDAKYDATKSVQTGNTLINIGGNAIVDYVYGAGLGGGNSVTTTGNIGIVIDGEAQVKGSVVGGWQSRHRSNPTVTGNTTVLVKNVQTHASDATLSGNASSDRGWIIGGSMYKTNGGYGQINGNSAVVIDIPSGNTGSFAKALIGGCYMTNDGNTMTVKGSSSVTITAPDDVTFAQTIVGGGHSTGAGSNVEGNSSVTINGGKFTGNIYAGGDHNNATVAGTATITVNGGNVSGATFKPGKANGVKKLQFNTNQEFYYSNIADFGEVGVAADKTLIVKVSGSNVKDLGKFSGAGTLKKQESGTLRISGGTEGKIVVDAGTLSIKLTVDQQLAGYQTTATVNGGTLNFIDATTGSVLDNSSTTPGVFEMPKNAWMGTAGDGNWDTAGNWSYGTVPTAEQIIALTTEGTVNVTSSSVCKQLIVDANVTLAGQIAANAMPNIVIDNGKTLTINTTAASTINGVSGGTLIKDGTATLSAKVGSGTDTAPLHDMAVVIKNGKLMIDQPTGTEATIHDVAFTIEETACGEDKVPLDNYGWFSATGPWSIETTGHARVFNNNNNNTSVIKGNGAFTKLGTGKVTILSSVGNSGNAYTGNVTVSAGELVLQPSGNGQCPNMTGTTTVNADATLTAKISSTAAANIKLASNGTFNVDQGNVNMTKDSDQSVKGTVNIAQGATLTNASNDAIAYGGSTTVNVRGTLAMGSTRWTVGGSSTINLYGGCSVTGDGDGESVFDLYHSGDVITVRNVEGKATVVEISAIRTRNDQAAVKVEEGMTLKITSMLDCNSSEGTILFKTGAGDMIVTGTVASSVQIKLSAGTIQTAATASVTTDVEGKMVVGDGSEETPYALATIVAKIGTTPYASIEDAISALGEGQTITLVDTTVELPAGWTTVTTEGVVTLRQAGEIGWKTYSANEHWTSSTAFKYGEGETSMIEGDTVVVSSDLTIYIQTTPVAKNIKVANNATLRVGCESGTNLDNGWTITAESGTTVKFIYWGHGDTNTGKIGNVTFNGEGSFEFTNENKTMNAGTIAGNATISIVAGGVVNATSVAETISIVTPNEAYKVVSSPIATGVKYEAVIRTYTITITPVEHTTVTVDGAAYTESTVTVDYGTNHTVVYTAEEGWTLVGEGTIELTSVVADTTVGADLSTKQNTISIAIPEAPEHMTVAVTDADGETITIAEDGAITIVPGSTFKVTYTPDEGYCGSPVSTTYENASASTEVVAPSNPPALGVAKVGTMLYASLDNAKSACTGTETIVIVSDLTGLTDFAKASNYTTVGAIEIAAGVTAKGYFPLNVATIPLKINGVFEIVNGFSNPGNHTIIPTLSGTGKITKSWSSNPVIYVQEHSDWNPSEASPDCIKLSVAKSADAYFYDSASIITALRNGTEVTNIGYTAETVPSGLAIDGDKLVLATYTVELKTFDHTVCLVKVNDGKEFAFTETFTVNHGDKVVFHYVANEGYQITAGSDNFQYSSVTFNVTPTTGTVNVTVAKLSYTITITSVEHTTVTVDGEAYAESTVTVEYGDDVTIAYVPATNYKLVGTGTFELTNVTADQTVGENLSAVLDVTTIMIPEAPANTTVKVTVGGTEVTVENNSITATIGAAVVVTYSAADGYIMDDVVTEFTASTTAPTITVPTATPIVAVAKIGETLYPTLAAAFAVGGEVTLLQNTTETLTIAAGKSVTLNLNGKMIASATNTITVKGTLVVTEAAGGIASTGSGKSAITTSGSGTFTINGGAITAVGTAVSGVGTITGGTITSSGSFAVYANSSSGSIEITGGTITGAAAKGDVGVYSGNVKVTGVTLTNGIKFASNASGIILADTDTTLFTPELGIYDGETLVGYAPAQTTGTISAMAGKTVKLLDDCTTTDYLTIGKSCTLDLNGHNLTTSAAAAIVVKGTSATPSVVTITGSGKVSSTAADCNAVQIGAYATVTIAGGEYVVPTDNSVIYIATSYAAKPSTVTITGGTFASGDGKYVLNIKDDQVARGAAISVTGGTFKGFDPSNCISEGAGTNFVADGYESVKDGDNYRVQVKLMPEEPTVDEKGDLVIPTPTGATTVEVSVEGEKISDGKIPLTDTGLYTVTAKNAGGEVIAESQIGVVVTTKKTGTEENKPTVAVAVPFTGATVANLLDTTNFTNGDQLKAFINGAYAMWTFKEGKWTSGTTVLAEGLRSAPNADTTPLARGSAVWVTTAGKVVAFGAYESTAVEPEVSTGYNLIGNPMMEAITPAAKTVGDVLIPVGSSTRYKVIEKTVGGVKKNVWQCKKSVQDGVIPGTTIPAFGEDVSEEDPTVEVGGSVWLIK